jgi:hypothetical protein
VRFIYTDEAGTSANEPVTVVVGVIVHADTQWMAGYERIMVALSKVPAQYREEFIFHAKSVWGDTKFREGWSKDERVALLLEMMTIPRVSGIALSYGLFYRDGEIDPNVNLEDMAPEEYQHIQAFGACMASADQFITSFAAPAEIATVVAEDIPPMRKRLRDAALRLRSGSMSIQNALVTQQVAGEVSSNKHAVNLRIRRVVDDVHFASKVSAPFLWVADAVAFGLRRYFSNQTFGLDFAKAIMGPDTEPPERNRDCACGYMCHERPPGGNGNPFPGD